MNKYELKINFENCEKQELYSLLEQGLSDEETEKTRSFKEAIADIKNELKSNS
ncbi:MAG: hypothetical protein R3Y09_13955 [Clostridia bacterium]